MAVPKQRHTKSRRDKRRSQIKFRMPQLAYCQECKREVLAHRACPFCGAYSDLKVRVRMVKKEVVTDKKKRRKDAAGSKKKKQQQKEQEAASKPLSLEQLSKK